MVVVVYVPVAPGVCGVVVGAVVVVVGAVVVAVVCW